MSEEKIILGIETSCDDTSIAILKGTPGQCKPKVLSHTMFSQIDILKEWGGVVPEIAARNHLEKLPLLLKKALNEAKIKLENIDLISVTTLPGLLGPLLTGLNCAKTISLYHKKPLLPVNHLFAHLEAIHLTEEINYPYIGLLVSGGHSIYFHVQDKNTFKVLGSTIDDAAGEAFDKGGKLMGLGYPAGRIIDDLAKKGKPTDLKFPIGLNVNKETNLSYSGVKTALRVHLQERTELIKTIIDTEDEDYPQEVYDICLAYQDAIVKALVKKLKASIKKSNDDYNTSNLPIVVGGGVACNSELRKQLADNFNDVHFVAPKFCTDNGAMIANYGLIHFDKALPYPQSLDVDARGRYIDKTDFQKGKK